MSLPVKIAIGTLGGGTVAVSGYEAVSYATGKPGLLFDHSVVKQSEETSSQPPQQKTEKAKIKELIDNNFNCKIKIKTSENKLKTIDDSSEQELSGLLTHIQAIFQDCKNETPTKKERVFENITTGWQELTDEKQKVDAWAASNGKFSGASATCTLKIFSGHESKDIDGNDALTGLYDFLSESTSLCKGTDTTNKKEVVVQNSSETWKVMNERDQIVEFLKDTTNFKCTIKIKNDNDDQGTTINAQTPEEKVEGLLKKLKELKTSQTECKDGEKKDLILKKETNNWVVHLTVKQQIEKLINDNTSKCTVTFKLQSSTETTQTLEKITNSASLQKLLEKLKELTATGGECANAPTAGGAKSITLQEKVTEGNYSWDKEVGAGG